MICLTHENPDRSRHQFLLFRSSARLSRLAAFIGYSTRRIAWCLTVVESPQLDLFSRLEGRDLIRFLVDQFAARMMNLAAGAGKFHVVDSRNTLAPGPADWNDEIHPTHRGFKVISEKWRVVFQAIFRSHGFA